MRVLLAFTLAVTSLPLTESSAAGQAAAARGRPLPLSASSPNTLGDLLRRGGLCLTRGLERCGRRTREWNAPSEIPVR